MEGAGRTLACSSQTPALSPQALNCLLMKLLPNKSTHCLNPPPPEYIPARPRKCTVGPLSEKSSVLGRVDQNWNFCFFLLLLAAPAKHEIVSDSLLMAVQVSPLSLHPSAPYLLRTVSLSAPLLVSRPQRQENLGGSTSQTPSGWSIPAGIS